MAELAPAALDKFNKQLNDELSGRFQEFEKLAAGYKQISDDVFRISKQINKYIPGIIDDTNKMIDSTGKMQEKVNDLMASVERTCESLESQEKASVKEFDRTCAELKPLLEHIGKIEEGFGELDKNLAGTFDKINSGMKEYMNHVDDTFNKIAEKASEYKK